MSEAKSEKQTVLTSPSPRLAALRRAAARAEARMRFARVVSAFPTSATLALVTVGVALALRKMASEHVPESWTLAMMIGAGVSVVATLVYAAVMRLPPGAGAIALDGHHKLSGRLSNALEFDEIAADARTPLMDAAIDDACETARNLSARRAVYIPFPTEIALSVAVAVAVAGISLLEVKIAREVPKAAKVATTEMLEIPKEDLDKYREALEHLREQDPSPEVQEAIRRFAQLIKEIEERRLNREDAFKRMQEIENDLLKGAEADKKALEEQLKETAKELEKSAMSKPVGESLQKKDYKKAKEELEKLSKKLKSEKKPNKAELERLRKALSRAAEKKRETLKNLIQHRNELSEEVLKKKQELKKKEFASQKEKEKEEALLRKKERELERLSRNIDSQKGAQRRLDRLDRALSQAAADLAKDLGLTAEDLQKIAEELNRLEKEELSDNQKEELRKRLEDLRDQIRQHGQQSQQTRERLQRFLERAKGMKGKQGQGKQGQGKQGQGKQGQGKQGQGKQGQGQQGQGQDGEGMGEGQGQGQGQGEGEGEFMLGPGGIPIPIPGGGGNEPGAEGEGEGEGEGDKPGGQGNDPGGKSYGSGSGGDPAGKATDIAGKTHDVRAEGVDHKGPKRTEVILSAAERGFRGKPYKNVYRQYRTVAEDQIEQEKIPDGMRFYVRRYFDLIRPRDD